MRKLFIITGMIASLGIQNIAMADDSWFSYGWFPSQIFKKKTKPAPPPPPTPSKEYLETIKLLKQQLKIYQNLLLQKEITYSSLTGTRNIPLQVQSHQSSSHFLNPYLIYNKENIMQYPDMQSTYMKDLKGNISKNENNLHQILRIINERLQYATAMDKAVSLQALTQVEKRFQAIADISAVLDKMNDLKGIAEVQVHIDGMLAMIQNEATKLQMVAYSRDAEQALIKQQKRALHAHIFKKGLSTMPRIRINGRTMESL